MDLHVPDRSLWITMDLHVPDLSFWTAVKNGPRADRHPFIRSFYVNIAHRHMRIRVGWNMTPTNIMLRIPRAMTSELDAAVTAWLNPLAEMNVATFHVHYQGLCVRRYQRRLPVVPQEMSDGSTLSDDDEVQPRIDPVPAPMPEQYQPRRRWINGASQVQVVDEPSFE